MNTAVKALTIRADMQVRPPWYNRHALALIDTHADAYLLAIVCPNLAPPSYSRCSPLYGTIKTTRLWTNQSMQQPGWLVPTVVQERYVTSMLRFIQDDPNRLFLVHYSSSAPARGMDAADVNLETWIVNTLRLHTVEGRSASKPHRT